MTATPLVGYQTQWPANFISAQAQLRRLFEADLFRIEHIGSTAVVGLCAKPVIDILLGAPSWALIEAQVPALAEGGYTYRPEYEAQLPERRYFVRPAQGAMPRIHLHAVLRGRHLWQQHLAFRDALRVDAQLAQRYGALKRELAHAHAHAHANDRAAYTAAKAPFITAVLADTQISERAARPDDALCLSVLAMQVFLDTYATAGIRPAIAREVLGSYSQAVFERSIADPQTRLCVAERAGLLVGFAQVTLGARHELAPATHPAELLRLYVQEPFTGSGLGSRLLAQAEQLARQAGADLMWLTPWVHNHRALGFYASRGYTDRGLTHFVFEGEAHENRVVVKRLYQPALASGHCDNCGP